MSVSKSQLDKARSDAKSESCAVFGTYGVKKYHETSSGSATRVLVLTDIFASYYDKSSDERTRYYWNQLKSISCGSGDVVVLNFLVEGPTKDTWRRMKFKSKDIRDILATIGSILCRVKPPHEVREMDIQSYGVEITLPNGRGLLSRFLGACFLLQSSEFREVRDLFERDFAIHKPIVVLNERKSAYFEAFLTGVSIGEWCQCVHASNVMLKSVVKYMEAKSSVIHLHLTNLLTEKWGKFCGRLAALKESQFKGWTLEDTELTDDELENLAHSIDSFTSIGFINSLKNPATFFGAGPVDRLEFVRIERANPFALESVLPKLLSVKILSLADCQLELRDAFNAIFDSGLRCLRYINLSRNKCTVTPLNERDCPSWIQRIDVDDIQWGRNCLLGFLHNVLNGKWEHGLHLSVSRFQSSDDIDEVFQDADRHPLRGLSWNSNPITKYFIRYISKCDQLQSLFVNQCFSQSSDLFEKFCDAVRDLPCLRVLSLTGSSDKSLKESLTTVLDKITQSSIEMIDFGGHGVSPSFIEKIPDFCRANPRLTCVACDNNQVPSIDCFQAVINGIKALGRQLVFKYPENDIQALHEAKTIDNNDIKALKGQFNGVEVSDDDVYWNRPFDIDQPTITDAFPEFITPELRASMDSEAPLTGVKSRNASIVSNSRRRSSGSESGEFVMKPKKRDSDSSSERKRRKRKVSDSDSDSAPKKPRIKISDSDSNSVGVKKRKKLALESSSDEPPKPKRKVSSDSDEKKPKRKLSLRSIEKSKSKSKRKLSVSSDEERPKPKRRMSDSSSDKPRKKSSPRKAAPVRRIVFSDSDSEPRKKSPKKQSKRMISSESDERPPKRSSRRNLRSDSDSEGPRRRSRKSDDRNSSRRTGFPIDVSGKSTTKKTLMDLEDKFSMEKLARAIID